MVDIKPEELADVRSGAILGQHLTQMEEYINKMLRQIEVRAYTAINGDRLSQELAQMLWFEHKTASDMLRKMRQDVRVGESKASVVSTQLDLGE